MNSIKALEKLREYSRLDDCKWTLDNGETVFMFNREPDDPRAVNWGEQWRQIADEIEAEIAEKFIELPLDADGVPIRPGDDVQLTDGRRADANCITYFEDTVDVGSDGWNPIWLRHVKSETVESIIGESIQFGAHADTGTRLEGRIAEYSERIRAIVDTSEERDRLRAEVKKLGEQLDRLRNDRGMA